jgi:hypothetical protein
VVHQKDEALTAFRALMKRYKSLRPQLADMSLVILCQQVEASTVFTLDRRDFTVYRVKGKKLRLLPESF